jgi:hypothetical protein
LSRVDAFAGLGGWSPEKAVDEVGEQVGDSAGSSSDSTRDTGELEELKAIATFQNSKTLQPGTDVMIF